MNSAPIFIHSLFRAGSTYLFKVFRRSSAGYWCYQEALHEFVCANRFEPAVLLTVGAEASQLYRHPQLKDVYWKELCVVWPVWKDTISEPIIYDAYFEREGEDIGIAYWRALADAAFGRPVFQECRTSGRIGGIKKEMGGTHIYLWRNPWDQWWSYKVTPYFDVANQLIIHAIRPPQPVQRLLAALDLPAYKHHDLAGAFAFYGETLPTSEQSYLVFYLLWCLALREGMTHADLMLNIDRLSDSVDYQSEILARLKDAGIDGIDFSDCSVPQGWYLERELVFFRAVEGRVHQWLIEGGWSEQDIDQIQSLRQQCQPATWRLPIENLVQANLTEQGSRARELVKRYETSQAERARNYAAKLIEIGSRAQQAEGREAQVTAQLQQALVVARQAQEMAQQAEARAQQAEGREAQVTAQLQQALEVARQAQEAAQQAGVCVQQLKADLEAVHQANHHHWQLAEERGQYAQAMLRSTSWRITAPLRWAMTSFRSLGRIPGEVVLRLKIWLKPRLVRAVSHPVSKRLIERTGRWVIAHPRLWSPIRSALRRNERLWNRLRWLVLGLPVQSSIIGNGRKGSSELLPLADLTPRASQIYQDLRKAIAASGSAP